MVFFYISFAAVAFQTEHIMQIYVTKACNESGHEHRAKVAGAVFYSAVTVALVFLSGVTFVYGLICLCKTLGHIFEIYTRHDPVIRNVGTNCLLRFLLSFWDKFNSYTLRGVDVNETVINRIYLSITAFVKIVIELAVITGATYLVNILGRNSKISKDIHELCKGNWLERMSVFFTSVNDIFVHLSFVMCFISIVICGFYCLFKLCRTSLRNPQNDSL